jgi:cytochrome c2
MEAVMQGAQPIRRGTPCRPVSGTCTLTILLVSAACNAGPEVDTPHRAADGPAGPAQNPHPHQRGNPTAGRDVYRFETFGNEGFWTDAARLPKGMADARFTPKQALEAGLQIDAEAMDPAMRAALQAEFTTDLSAAHAPILNDPRTMVALVNANAVVGLVPKDTDRDGKLDIAAGDKVGVTCTLCHTVTDGSVYQMPEGGSVGRRVDGPAALTLNVGRLMALAANSRAIYPNLQQRFLGVSIGRASSAIGPNSTEAEVDAYLNDLANYPVGTFDETQDGNGNPVKNVPLFRQDLAAPYGTAGEFSKLDDISNSSYTTNLDPTTLVTPEGRQFLQMKAGPAGKQLADEYARILRETGVTGFPFVQAEMTGRVGDPASIVGRRVNRQKLLDMNAYLDALPAPRGATVDPVRAARGRAAFRTNCTQCHNVDQSRFVPPQLVAVGTMWRGYKPIPVGLRGDERLSTILNSPGQFDDKMVVVDASDRGEPRGVAMPLLLDLARTNLFLHDASVPSLDNLLDPARGANAPHAFYLADAAQRADVVEFLRGLDTDSSGGRHVAASSPASRSPSRAWAVLPLLVVGLALSRVGRMRA